MKHTFPFSIKSVLPLFFSILSRKRDVKAKSKLDQQAATAAIHESTDDIRAHDQEQDQQLPFSSYLEAKKRQRLQTADSADQEEKIQALQTQMTDMTQKLESMRTSLDDSRLSNQTLKSTRPTIRFLGYTSKAPWEVLSLQERL